MATELERAARHQAAHDLSSPIRAAAIVADLLSEALDAVEPDLEVLRELSSQLTTLTVETTAKLADFASALDD